ncbi:MAG: hypothetical protein IID33_12220 [Planctomycetes bacterium]|nr:hypothetical protein [Planctomycetota bacterium]
MWFKSSFTIPAVAAITFCLIGATIPPAVDKIHVPGDFSTVQPGIDAAVNGDEVVATFREIGCPWDLGGDGVVGVKDLLVLLGAWGPNPGHPADFNGDDVVGVKDLLALLGNWGKCP